MIEIFNKYIFLLFFWIWGLIQFCKLQLRNPKGFTELPPNLHPYPHPQSPHPGYKCWKGDWEVERSREAGGSDHSILLLSVLSVCTGKKKITGTDDFYGLFQLKHSVFCVTCKLLRWLQYCNFIWAKVSTELYTGWRLRFLAEWKVLWQVPYVRAQLIPQCLDQKGYFGGFWKELKFGQTYHSG